MKTNYMMTAEDVATELGISKGHAYKLIRQLNEELENSGFIVVAGKVPRAFWEKKKQKRGFKTKKEALEWESNYKLSANTNMDMTDKIKETEVLEKHIIGENGISYTLGEDGLYYPDLRLPEGTHYEIGRYGRMRAEYLKEYRRPLYLEFLLSGKLNEYLHHTDEECYQMMELLVEQMKEKQGVTEKLKSENQMQWETAPFFTKSMVHYFSNHCSNRSDWRNRWK